MAYWMGTIRNRPDRCRPGTGDNNAAWFRWIGAAAKETLISTKGIGRPMVLNQFGAYTENFGIGPAVLENPPRRKPAK